MNHVCKNNLYHKICITFRPFNFWVSLVFSFLAIPLNSFGEMFRATNVNNLETLSDKLAPGDTLKVASGNYDLESWNLRNLKGTETQWIHIIAEPGAVIRSTSGCCNLIQFGESAYIKLIGFEITMAEANPGIDGINVSGKYSHHLHFEGLKIHGMSGNGISVFSNLADHLVLLNSELASMEGSGMYWGYPNRDIVSDILVEGNYIHHCPVDPNQETDYGFQFKGWGHRARIINNVFHDVGGTTRSGLIVYYGKKPLAGDSPDDINVVSGNVLWNCRNEGITVMSDALIENNIVWSANTGINIQTYSDESFSGSNYVENLTVRNNTVFRCGNSSISISGWNNAANNVSFTGNVAYASTTSGTAISGSLGKGIANGNFVFGSASIAGVTKGIGLSDFSKAASTGQPPELDFYPASSSPFRDVLDPALCPESDFNGVKRPQESKCDAGAYEANGQTNPGWIPKGEFKRAGTTSIKHPKIKMGVHVPQNDGLVSKADGRAVTKTNRHQLLFSKGQPIGFSGH